MKSFSFPTPALKTEMMIKPMILSGNPDLGGQRPCRLLRVTGIVGAAKKLPWEPGGRRESSGCSQASTRQDRLQVGTRWQVRCLTLSWNSRQPAVPGPGTQLNIPSRRNHSTVVESFANVNQMVRGRRLHILNRVQGPSERLFPVILS